MSEEVGYRYYIFYRKPNGNLGRIWLSHFSTFLIMLNTFKSEALLDYSVYHDNYNITIKASIT